MSTDIRWVPNVGGWRELQVLRNGKWVPVTTAVQEANQAQVEREQLVQAMARWYSATMLKGTRRTCNCTSCLDLMSLAEKCFKERNLQHVPQQDHKEPSDA